MIKKRITEMTREEAITRIKDHIEIHRYHERNAVKIFEALDMAISALKQPEIIYCEDCVWWEKQKDSLQGRCDLMQMYPTGAWYCGNAQRRVTDG